MSNVLDKSFIHRSYPKLAYGSIYDYMVPMDLLWKYKVNKREVECAII